MRSVPGAVWRSGWLDMAMMQVGTPPAARRMWLEQAIYTVYEKNGRRCSRSLQSGISLFGEL